MAKLPDADRDKGRPEPLPGGVQHVLLGSLLVAILLLIGLSVFAHI